MPTSMATVAAGASIYSYKSDSPRALAANLLVDEARKWNLNVEIAPTVREAVERARQIASTEDVILVTGSFTTIAEVPRELH